MDPVTALGAAAGGFQLVDVAARALIATVRGLRSLREAPARTAAHLAEVEKSLLRISRVSAALLQPGTKVFDKLTVEQFGRLSSCALDARLAMEGLQRLLFYPRVALIHPSHPHHPLATLLRRYSGIAQALLSKLSGKSPNMV
jgi:hypothetical protein